MDRGWIISINRVTARDLQGKMLYDSIVESYFEIAEFRELLAAVIETAGFGLVNLTATLGCSIATGRFVICSR